MADPLAPATPPRPEVALLLWGARPGEDAAQGQPLRHLLPAELDWGYVLRAAAQHGVLPLLYHRLTTLGPDAVPQAIRAQLRAQFLANAAHNLLLTQELLTLLHLWAAHRISVIPYKGPTLAAAIYGNLALRQFGDLDILVRPQDARQAKALLVARGYHWWAQRPVTAWQRWRKVEELMRADGQVLVELHTAVTSWTFFFSLDAGRLWDRLETVSLAGTPVRTLAAEDLLLILCVHGAKHHWGRLGWICDIAALLDSQRRLKWAGLVAQARRLGGLRMLLLGVLLAHELLGATLPEALRRQLQADPILPGLAGQVRARLFSDADRVLAAVDQPAFYLGVRERLRDRVRGRLYLGYRLLTARVSQSLKS